MFIPMKPLNINRTTKNLQNVVENVSETRMLISIVSRPCMNDITIIDHVLFTHQLSDTKLWSKYCELK